MDLDWLKDFLALAGQGGFSRAAESRHVSQPAFSRRIRALEDWVGTPLFVRSAQGAALSPAGARFRPEAEALLAGLERARREARALGEPEAAALAVAATHALSFSFFPGWVRRQAHLDAVGSLNLISDSLAACESIMLAGEVHFLLCHCHPAAPTRLETDRFPSVRVGEDRLVPVSAPDAGGRPRWAIPGRAARPTRLLAYSPASGLGRILAACGRADTPGVEARGSETVLTSHLAATLMTMAREGHGAAWLPATLADDDLARGTLVAAGPPSLAIPIEIRLFRSRDCRSAAADALWARAGGG